MCQVTSGQSYRQELVWLSESEALHKWTKAELQKHLTSGRVAWREDPMTTGVFEYQDRGHIVVTRDVKKTKEVARQQEWEEASDSENEKEFKSLWDCAGLSTLGDLGGGAFSVDGPMKTLGGGHSNKGKGHKALPPLLAIDNGNVEDPPEEPEPQSEEELLAVAQQRTRKMRTMLATHLRALEEVTGLLTKSKAKFWSKAAALEAQQSVSGLHTNDAILAKLLTNRKATAEDFKQPLIVCACLLKTVLQNTKQYKKLLDQSEDHQDSRSVAPSKAASKAKSKSKGKK